MFTVSRHTSVRLRESTRPAAVWVAWLLGLPAVFTFSAVFVFFLGAVSPSGLYAQTAPDIEWQTAVGGPAPDYLFSVTATRDHGIMLGGGSFSDVGGDKKGKAKGAPDWWIVKMTGGGTLGSQRVIGGNDKDILIAFRQTKDGSYIAGGWSVSNISGDKLENSRGKKDYWVIRMSADGQIKWQRTYGGAEDDELTDLIETADGGFLVGGKSHSPADGDKTDPGRGESDFWILKLDADGNIQWQRTLGGNNHDELVAVLQTPDGGYLLGGSSWSGLSGDKTEDVRGFNSYGEPLSDFWIVKLDAMGQIKWQRTVGGTNHDKLAAMTLTPDGGFVVGGSTQSNIGPGKSENGRGKWDFWIVKFDATGQAEWDKSYGGAGNDFLYSIIVTSDDGLFVGGSSDSGRNDFDHTPPAKGNGDFWVMKLSPVGDLDWQQSLGGPQTEELRGILQTHDGGFLIAGNSASDIGGDKTVRSRGARDFWVVKLLPEGMNAGGSEFDQK